jgi:hypothetical protein
MPNTDNEIHLEPVLIKDIYEEYVEDMGDYKLERVNIEAFRVVWTDCFPNVRIREFKAVTGKLECVYLHTAIYNLTGKCEMCAILSHLRRSFRSSALRETVTRLHAYHRSAYMGERQDYADRQLQACSSSADYLSSISDGMAQSHCKLPWKANLNDGFCLSQHLQGIYFHGRQLIIYRTFHNVPNGGNLGVHTFLLGLERIYLKEKALPSTIYHQIDGGSENTSKIFIAICELLVVRRLCTKLVLTRYEIHIIAYDFNIDCVGC